MMEDIVLRDYFIWCNSHFSSMAPRSLGEFLELYGHKFNLKQLELFRDGWSEPGNKKPVELYINAKKNELIDIWAED